MSLDYHVVFRDLVGSTRGAITSSSWETKPEFDEWYKGKMDDGTPLKNVYEVVAEGIPESEIDSYIDQTPLSSHLNYALESSRNPQTGEINEKLLELNLENVILAKKLRK